MCIVIFFSRDLAGKIADDQKELNSNRKPPAQAEMFDLYMTHFSTSVYLVRFNLMKRYHGKLLSTSNAVMEPLTLKQKLKQKPWRLNEVCHFLIF